MTLCLFLASTGYHSTSWRTPGADPLANINPAYFTALARRAEEGGLDAVFLADSMAVWSDPAARPVGAIEPAVLASAILQTTSTIGVIITQSTSYNEPFNVARRLTSLDHLGGGRIGWNIVTSATREAALNFGLATIPDHSERYRRADEFVRVCIALWHSWGSDAIIADPLGRWADPAGIRPIHHEGEFFRVRGPLDVPPSPQRVPLLVQAGSSPDGMELASTYADLVFTVQSEFGAAREFRRRLQAMAARRHRRPVRVLPGLIPIVGSTDEEARRRQADLDSRLDPRAAIQQLEKSLALPPDSLEPDAPFTTDLARPECLAGNQSYLQVIKDMAAAGRYTVREVAQRMSSSRGHRLVVGSPETVADAMIDWVTRGAADGYILMPAVLPADLEPFVDEVIPLLRSKGYLRDPLSGPLASRFRNTPMGASR
ncbi:NtaA/DmoA family FMN-dependent monooxygenase [Prescottella agglutinans]|nr:NtaA/DmoA family FMN-dependent monooxygenase [Prescottella agglutinans]